MKLARLFVVGITVTLASALPAFANELHIDTGAAVRVAGGDAVRIEARVMWRNGWRNARNHDAAWIVVKLRTANRSRWTHARLVSVTVTKGTHDARCEITNDRVGVMCGSAASHRGDVDWTLAIDADAARLGGSAIDARVLGLEMVYVPPGPFSGKWNPGPRSSA